MCELGLGAYMVHYTLSALYPTIHVVLPTAKYPIHLTIGSSTEGRPKVSIHLKAYNYY